jgi:hypothetical protein
MALTITALRQANTKWFSPANKHFFGDLEYRVLHGKSKTPYLVRRTYAWSNMFADISKPHWRINPIGVDLSILSLHDEIFQSLGDVKQELKLL